VIRDAAGRRLHYAWVVAGASFLALVMAAGFRATSGVLLVPLHVAFGWSHETISLAVAVNLMVYGLASPFAAAAIERFGMRRVMVIALVVVGVSALATTRMDAPWQLYLLWGVVNGAATAAIAIPLAAIVANRWFVKRQGLVTGLLSASNASGQLVFLPFLAWIAGFDWRFAAAAVAAAALLIVAPVVAAFVRDHPAQIGLRPYGSDVDVPVPAPLGNPFRQAIGGLGLASRSPTFWLLAGSFFICGATTNGLVSTHLIPAAHDHGITQVTAAGLLALIGVFDVIGTVGSGWLTDRYDSRWLLFWYYGLRGLSLIALPFLLAGPQASLVAFAVFYGLDWVSTVPPTAALTAQTFGRAHLGIVFGWIFGAHQLGAAFAAETAGAVRTLAGDYELAFIGAGILALVASALVLRIARRPQPALADAV
jgi:sugar phosphate permease